MSKGDLVLVEVGRRTGWLFGSGSMVVPAVKMANSPRQWDDQRKAWMVPVGHLSDVIAALEYRMGADVEVKDVDR